MLARASLLVILHAQQRETRSVVFRTLPTDAEGAYTIFKDTDLHLLFFTNNTVGSYINVFARGVLEVAFMLIQE